MSFVPYPSTPLPHVDWFYSDPHFFHGRIVGYTKRPFFQRHEKDWQAMNEELVSRYNACVKPGDFCLWLGDSFFHTSRKWASDLLESLNGHKGLILGNHDGSRTKMLDIGFEWVEREYQIHLAGKKVRLHHYPYLSNTGVVGRRNPIAAGEDALIHGHTHSSVQVQKNMVNVCVEAWDYRPVRREIIAGFLKDM